MAAAARLFVPNDLGAGLAVSLSPDQAHYLRAVLRRGRGDLALLFNGRDGEWLGRIAAVGKGYCTVELASRRRAQEPEAALDLAFAPVKRARIDLLVEKASELGATDLRPVRTARTVVERLNLERLRAHAVEAAEQSERLSVPRVHEPQDLEALLAAWPAARPLILCDETGRAPPIAAALAALPAAAAGAGLLIGPEGGFTESELDALAKLPFVNPVGLGPRVLRSETAALAALAVFQAVVGDWRRRRSRGAANDPLSQVP